MLNFTEISEKIENPSTIKMEDLEHLEQLSKRYPFTSVFPMLFLKGLALHNTIRFEAELENYAYRISDREQLYNLINLVEKNEPVQEVVLEEVLDEEIVEDLVVNETVEVEETVSEEIEEVAELEIEEEPKAADQEDEVSVESEEIEQEERSFDKERLKKVDDLERDILAHAVSSAIALEIDSESTVEYNFSKLRAIDEENELDEEEVVENVEELEEEIEVETGDSSKKSFTSWLSSYQAGSEEEKEEFVEEKEDISSEKEEKENNLKEISLSEKKKVEFYSPVKKATESLDETRLPVSETLAKVYAMQGNFPKAISAYEKLSLKYPEKKVYFANLIKELKNKLK